MPDVESVSSADSCIVVIHSNSAEENNSVSSSPVNVGAPEDHIKEPGSGDVTLSTVHETPRGRKRKIDETASMDEDNDNSGGGGGGGGDYDDDDHDREVADGDDGKIVHIDISCSGESASGSSQNSTQHLPPWFFQTARKCNRCGHVFHRTFTAEDFRSFQNGVTEARQMCTSCPQCSMSDPAKILFRCPFCIFHMESISAERQEKWQYLSKTPAEQGLNMFMALSSSGLKRKYPQFVLWMPHTTSTRDIWEHVEKVHSKSDLIDPELYCQIQRAKYQDCMMPLLHPHTPMVTFEHLRSPHLLTKSGSVSHSEGINNIGGNKSNSGRGGSSDSHTSHPRPSFQQATVSPQATPTNNLGSIASRKYALGRALGSPSAVGHTSSPSAQKNPPKNATPSEKDAASRILPVNQPQANPAVTSGASRVRPFVDMMISTSQNGSEVIVSVTQYPKVFASLISKYLSLNKPEDRVAMIKSNEVLRKVLLLVESHCKKLGMINIGGAQAPAPDIIPRQVPFLRYNLEL